MKVILYPVLPFHYLFSGLSRLSLGELAVMCPLRLKPGLAHLDRQVVTVGKPLSKIPCFVLEMLISLVLQLHSLLHLSISVSLLSVLPCFSDTPSSGECVASFLLASSLCFCASSTLFLASLSSFLHCISAVVPPQLKFRNTVNGNFYLSLSFALLRSHLSL